MDSNQVQSKLTSEEQSRLDEILSEAKAFHYRSFALSITAFAISIVSAGKEFVFFFQNVGLPKIHTVVGLYFGVIVMTYVSMTLFLSAKPYLDLDERRPPFPWIALPIKRHTASQPEVAFWLSIPLLLCCLSTSLSLGNGEKGWIWLSFSGFIGVITPGYLGNRFSLIHSKSDERGGNATFSIYLLYWYRTIRHLVFSISLLVSILWIIPEFRPTISQFHFPSAIIVTAFGIRGVCGLRFVYTFIDNCGVRFGFPNKSEHY